MITEREYRKNQVLLNALLLQREARITENDLYLNRELSLEISDLLRAYESNIVKYKGN
jgi:hypothetical protein